MSMFNFFFVKRDERIGNLCTKKFSIMYTSDVWKPLKDKKSNYEIEVSSNFVYIW